MRAVSRALVSGMGDELLRRRDFLRRTAYTAGLAAATSVLPLDVLMGQAARTRALASGMPSPSTMPIDHFVVLMMENRSFDHYFGWYGDKADAVQARTYPDPQAGGAPVATQHASFMGAGQWQGCGHPDPPHDWDGGRDQLGQSRTNPALEPDGFLAGASDEFALTLLRPGRGPVHPRGRDGVHGLRPLLLLADGLDVAEPLLQVVGAVGRAAGQHAAGADRGNQWDTIFDLAGARRA